MDLLALFNKDVGHPLPQVALDDLNERILSLGRMAGKQATATIELVERGLGNQQSSKQEVALDQTWLIGHDPEPWAALQSQLGHFGMKSSFISWENELPDNAGNAPLLLLDMSCLPEAEWSSRIQALRHRFAMGQLICLGVHSDFEQLQLALRGGCDSCLLEGTPAHAIVEHIMELNERHDQESYRVLIVARLYPAHDHPGRGSFVADQAAALVAAGHEVVVICPQPAPASGLEGADGPSRLADFERWVAAVAQGLPFAAPHGWGAPGVPVLRLPALLPIGGEPTRHPADLGELAVRSLVPVGLARKPRAKKSSALSTKSIGANQFRVSEIPMRDCCWSGWRPLLTAVIEQAECLQAITAAIGCSAHSTKRASQIKLKQLIAMTD